MARAHYHDIVLSPKTVAGESVYGFSSTATVNVYETGTTTPIAATIYSAASGAGTYTNPLNLGNGLSVNGELDFYLAAPQRLDLKVSGPGLTTTTFTVEVGDSATEVASTDVARTFTAIQTFAADAYFKSGRPWIDVCAYGADPTGVADSYAAITTAAAAAGSAYVLFFPMGTYKISDTLVFKSGYIWTGQGRGNTVISYTGAATAVSNDSILTDVACISGLSIRNAGTGTLGLSLGHCRRCLFRKVDVRAFTTNIAVNKPDVAIGNYFNSFESVRSIDGTVGWVIGKAGDGANNNYFYGCESYSDTTAINWVQAAGCRMVAMHVEGATDVLGFAQGTDNYIEIYAETSTNLGSADAGSYDNTFRFYRDGTATFFVDNGANNQEATYTLASTVYTQRRGPVETLDKYQVSFTAATRTFARLTIPYNGAFRVTISEAGVIPGVDNYSEIKVFDVIGKAGVVTTTQISTTGSNQISKADAGNNVTFSIVGNAGIAALYQCMIHVVGVASDVNGQHQYATYARL